MNDKRALALGLCAVVLWSTVATAFKLALEELTVLQLLAVAALSSTAVLTVHLALRGELRICLRMIQHHWLECLLMGTLSPCLYYWVLLTAYDRLPAQQAQTINYTWAITLALFSIPVLKQRLSGPDWMAVVLGYLGALIIATKGQPLSLEFTDGLGVTLALASTFLWAAFWLLNARSQHPPAHALMGYFVCALPLLAA
ncbi:MAG: DMT family transporter, partial [Pseudomonadota bacterium]